MSDQNTTPNEKLPGTGLIQSYLGFLDTSVLFKKPVSCLFAIVSLLIPVVFLGQAVQNRLFEINGKTTAACILILLFLIFAGIFGALLWYRRRIVRDDGKAPYVNFRRFLQTLGEWLGTMIAIIVFSAGLVLLLFFGDGYSVIAEMIPFFSPGIHIVAGGPVAGFVIIVATHILLFLLDPFIWLVKQIWKLFVRIVLYCYRVVLAVHGVIEHNAAVWIGVIWLVSLAAVSAGLVLLFLNPVTFWGGIITTALGLGFMGFLVITRKKYDAA